MRVPALRIAQAFLTDLSFVQDRVGLMHCFIWQVPQWSRIGRLKRSAFPNLGGGGHTFGGGAGAGMMASIAGRLLCDTYLGARELLREVDYTMTTLARVHLGQCRSDLAAADVPGGHAFCNISDYCSTAAGINWQAIQVRRAENHGAWRA